MSNVFINLLVCISKHCQSVTLAKGSFWPKKFATNVVSFYENGTISKIPFEIQPPLTTSAKGNREYLHLNSIINFGKQLCSAPIFSIDILTPTPSYLFRSKINKGFLSRKFCGSREGRGRV